MNMKRKIYFVAGLLFVLHSFSSAFSQERLKNEMLRIVPKAMPNWEYVVNNPLFIDKFYITDLDKVKGKVLKENLRSYELNQKGEIVFDYEKGDTQSAYYYKFSDEGVIEAVYTVTISQNIEGILKEQTEKTFLYSDDCIEENISEKSSWSRNKNVRTKDNIIYHDISYVDGGVKIVKREKTKNMEYFFQNKDEKLTVEKGVWGKDKTIYSGNTKNEIYEYSEGKLSTSDFSVNGIRQEYFSYRSDGTLSRKDFLKRDLYTEEYYDEQGKKKSSNIKNCKIRLDEAGFIKNREVSSYKKTAGRYEHYSAVLLDSFDDEYNSAFGK